MAFLIISIGIKLVYGNLIGPSLAYTTLADSEILATQSQTVQPKMDIKAIQASLEDVLKQYQVVINSTNRPEIAAKAAFAGMDGSVPRATRTATFRPNGTSKLFRPPPNGCFPPPGGKSPSRRSTPVAVSTSRTSDFKRWSKATIPW